MGKDMTMVPLSGPLIETFSYLVPELIPVDHWQTREGVSRAMRGSVSAEEMVKQ